MATTDLSAKGIRTVADAAKTKADANETAIAGLGGGSLQAGTVECDGIPTNGEVLTITAGTTVVTLNIIEGDGFQTLRTAERIANVDVGGGKATVPADVITEIIAALDGIEAAGDLIPFYFKQLSAVLIGFNAPWTEALVIASDSGGLSVISPS